MQRAALLAIVVLAGGVARPAPALADDAPATDYFAQPNGGVKFRQGRSRTRDQKLLIGGLAGGAALSAAVGIYFHLDANRISGDLAADTPQDVRWSEEHQDKYDRGQLDGTIAIVSYVVAAGLIGGTIAAVLLTDPGEEVVEVKTRRVQPTARLVPGGGTVGAEWSW
jgi:hypothetical protein